MMDAATRRSSPFKGEGFAGVSVGMPTARKAARSWKRARALQGGWGMGVSVALGLLLASVLAACGFQLRGSTELPFRTLWVGFSDASPLGTEFKRYIRSGTSTRLVDDADASEARLEVLGESRDKEILSLNANGRVREYSLFYTFVFKVDDGKGRDFIPPTRITLRRNISVNENTQLAKEAEENLLYRDMQSDLVQQLLRRLAAVKPDAAAPS